MHDTIRFIPAAELRPQTWKNGGGVTRQIAIYPEHAAQDDFIWRISAAEVAQPGPFSFWPDIDRILVLTGGESMLLTRTETGAQHRLMRGERIYFAGETAFDAALPDGPTRDFNLMLRRKQAHGCVDMRRSAQKLALRPGETVLHCTDGRFELRLPQRLGGMRTLDTGDTLWLTLDYIPAFTLDIAPGTDDARLVDARINLYPGVTVPV
jgi:environmental stress-induced protein Ves